MKNLVTFITSIFLVASLCCKAPSEIFNRCNKSIVKINVAHGSIYKGCGSGVCIGPHLIATNRHVVEGATNIVIEDGLANREVPVENVIVFGDCDLAFVRMPYLNAQPIDFEMDTPANGDTVYALGCPLGIKNILSVGTYNGIRREEDSPYFVHFTAPISPGSSGGALLSSRGRLLGLTCAMMRDSQNLNLAVPAYQIKAHLEEFR